MEDSLSVKSNESVATSDEFDFVCDKPNSSSKTPTLDITEGDFNSLARAMTEVLKEQDDNIETQVDTEPTKVGQSMFYIQGSPTEKQDIMKPDYEDEVDEVSDVDQDCTIFNGIKYLGAANIIQPKCDAEIQRNIAVLNEEVVENGIKVSVSVPSSSQGVVVLYDANTNSVISRYEIHRILYFCAGVLKSPEASCFAFTWSHGDTQEATIFQCHVFRCDIAEAVPRVSACFVKAFERAVASSRSMTSSLISNTDMSTSCTTLSEARQVMYVFEVNLEIKEDDGRGFSSVAKDRSGFRLRCNLDKQICLNIRQVSDEGPILQIERCFGVLLAPGRHVRNSDMQLLEMIETSATVVNSHKNCCSVSACWDASEDAFNLLNVETPKDGRQYMTIAIDLVIRGIQEPVRFQIESPVKIYHQSERFWLFQKRGLVQQFFLNLKETINENADIIYEVVSMDSSGELDRNRLNLMLNLSGLINSPSITSIDTMTPKDEYLSDGDEPLLSGTGLVSKDCSDDVLELWGVVLSKWNESNQPKQLSRLVKLGIPEALRGKVWQRLARTDENIQLMENYRILITKDSSCEDVIQRDIARTFPAHDFFKQVGGLGQDSLYRVSKAYAVYDVEVGYCQGLSFLAATLLLHMPEEEAFCVLVKLMYDYGLRDLYKDGFDNLYLRLYQLNKLMEEQLGQLYEHFLQHNIETHMFASQWFLTLFTARFPLFFVFHIIDVFLLQGIDTLFQVALALLMKSKKDLLSLDFEGILKFFRVSLPKKIRSEQCAKDIIKDACSIKVKKLKKYEAEFIALKDSWENIILDSEADSMETQASEVEQLRLVVTRQDEERKLHLDEIAQLKEMLKREVDQAELEQRNNEAIIADYKLVRHRLDSQLSAVTAELDLLKSQISKCDNCSKYLNGKWSNEDDDEDTPTERVRDLQFQLAKAKLAQVEAECKNQHLTHQLRSTENELNSSKNSWRPWLSKTLTSIKEVANKKDFPTFTQPTFISHVNPTRRDSAPMPYDSRYQPGILKDSASCSSLKTHN